MAATARSAPEAGVIRRLSTLDRLLPLWIALAMAGGLDVGSLIPGIDTFLDRLKVGSVSLPIAVGLLIDVPRPRRVEALVAELERA